MTTSFVLLTAAKNEGGYIGETIESVLRQSIHPLLWVIMDDGSDDDTAAIVETYAARCAFIRLQASRQGGPRSFGAQYHALNAGFEMVRSMPFEFVGVHDADISPRDVRYYERLLDSMQQDPMLGISGGYVHERARSGAWRERKANALDGVAGGIQMFRRNCYEQLGGYTPLQFGGEDWLMQLRARSAGWTVRADPSLPVHHHRPTSSAGGRMRGLFRLGRMDASFGSDIVFEVFKCARRIGERPLLLGSAIRFAGFVSSKVGGGLPIVPAEVVEQLRKEQRVKLNALLRRRPPFSNART